MELENGIQPLSREVVGLGIPWIRHTNQDGAPGGLIHPTAMIGPGAYIDETAVIGQETSIGTSAIIGKFVVIEGKSRIGTRAVIGNLTRVLPHVAVADGVCIGSECIIGNGASVDSNVPDEAAVHACGDLSKLPLHSFVTAACSRVEFAP